MVRLVPDIKGADDGASGLLIECRGQTPECLLVTCATLAILSMYLPIWSPLQQIASKSAALWSRL